MSKIILKSAALAAIGLVTVSSSAFASGTPRVDARQGLQAHRIYNGVATGRLSYRETASLVHGQARVARIEHRAKRDGVVTAGERARLGVAQSVQSGRIWWKKHN